LVAIIDNSPLGPYRYGTQRFRRVLEEITGEGVQALSFGNLDSKKALKTINEARALILGGFRDWVPIEQWPIPYAQEYRLVRETEKPLLGICGGHQLIALALGGSVEPLGQVVKGYRRVRVLEPDPLFNGLSNEIMVLESHQNHVAKLPEGFKLLASSSDTRVEAMRSEKGLVYGVQFHPERHDEKHPDGREILKNFWLLAKK